MTIVPGSGAFLHLHRTHFRAKGLEFKVVFLPRLGGDTFPRARRAEQSDAEYDDYRTLALSQLYVAMTRARDGVIVLCSSDPGPELAGAFDHFEVIPASS